MKKNLRKTFKWQICYYCLNGNGHKWWGAFKSGRACDIQKHDVHQVIIFFWEPDVRFILGLF